MSLVIIFPWLILWYTFPRINDANNHSSIAMKASPKHNYEPIAIGVETFKELIEGSDVFVDKSLLIKQILQRYVSTVVLTYPRNWGKSVNLNMLKTFLEIETDVQGNTIEPHSSTRNYRLFQYGEFMTNAGNEDNLRTPLLISNEEDLLLEYQGEYPVIYANFENMVSADNEFNLVRSVSDEVSRIFSQHEYMKCVFNNTLLDPAAKNERKLEAKERLERFAQIIKQVVTTDDTKDSLAFLSEILHEHFKKKVFILIDDYDVPLNNTFFGVADIPLNILQAYVDFYQKFLESTVGSEHVEKCVLTGTLPLAKELILPNVYHVENSNIMFNEFHRFYGFDENETDMLFDRLRININLREGFQARFYGYKVGVNSKTQIYQPTSVVKWLGKKNAANEVDDFALKFLHIDSFRNAISTIISGFELPADIADVKLNASDIDHLRTMSKNENFFGPLTSSALKYFYATGHLTLSEVLYEKCICFRFPNDEVYGMVRKNLIDYYEKKFSIGSLTFMPMTNHFEEKFAEFINSTAHTLDKLSFWLEKAVNTLYEHHVNATSEKENVIYSSLGYMLIFMDSYRRYPNFKPEIILLGEKYGVIVAASYNIGSGEYAVKKAENYVQLLKSFKLDKIKLIGIDVTVEMNVDIRGFDYNFH